MRKYSDVWCSVGIGVVLCISVTSAISSTLVTQKKSCYPPPKNLLWRYVRKDNLTALETLLTRRHGSDAGLETRFPCLMNQTLLHQAAGHGAHQAVTWLLDRGAHLEARDESGRTPLMEAARGGHSKAVRILLQRGADPAAVDSSGRNALQLGAGHPRVLEKMLRRNQGGVSSLLGASDTAGDTALHRAAFSGSSEAVQLLVQAGAQVNITNKAGETPLHVAILNRRLNATRSLLEAKADPDAPLRRLGGGEEDGPMRPLHLAVSGNGEEVVRLLLDRGAEVNARGTGGKTPLGLAMEAGRGVLVGLLKEKGGIQ